MRILSADEKSFFIEHGAVCLRQLLSKDWLAILERGFQKNLDEPSEHACYYTDTAAPGVFRDDYCNWTRIDEYRHTIYESCLPRIASELLNSPRVRFFHDHIFFKKAGTVKKTPWHQDLPYYCVDGDQALSYWIPLTDIDESNKIEFIAGSHRWGKLFMPTKFNGTDTYDVPPNLYEALPDLDAEGNTFTKLSWTMKVGDAIVFDFRTIHGNTATPAPNLVDRRSIAFRFLGDKMRYTRRPGEKSPPFPNLGLTPGEPLRHSLFPLVWPQANISDYD